MRFKDDAEIIELVRRFESCELDPAEFRHYQHLTVALWYVKEFPFDLASEKMRHGIKQLAAAYGKMGYNETITMFWLAIVREVCATISADEGICDLANRLIAGGTTKNLISEYYSEELLATSEAKQHRVEPDLKPLPRTMASIPSA